MFGEIDKSDAREDEKRETDAKVGWAEMTSEQSFFAVFCIESLADELRTTGNKVYLMLTEKSDILDDYILPCYDALHTQGKDYIVRELKEIMEKRGILG